MRSTFNSRQKWLYNRQLKNEKDAMGNDIEMSELL